MQSTKPFISLFSIFFLLWCNSSKATELGERTKRDSNKKGNPQDFVYWVETWQKPRPLKIFYLRFNMKSPHFAPVVVVNPPTSKDISPTEAILIDPVSLAAKNDLIFAVNTNAFAAVPGFLGLQTRHWYPGKPVEVKGWLKTRKKEHSLPEKGFACFYIDNNGNADICAAKDVSKDALLAVAGFKPLILDGKPIKTNPKNNRRHPRTMIGYDKNGFLYFVVVDGRQKGYSEGMTTAEQIELMKNLGCYEALNLDGGGSSVFVLKPENEELQILNKPPKNMIRPIPNLIGIKKKTVKNKD